MAAGKVKPSKIIAAPIEERYARGWHFLGLSQEFIYEPQCINAFGTKLVGFRGGDGQVHVLDGYCPHMGGDLSRGYLDGDAIRCPFHEWRWGTDGVCDDIPYAERIPGRAAIKKWPVLEVNRQVFVWNDPEESQPTSEITIPELDLLKDGDWNDWVLRRSLINTNCRELIDNVSDRAHFSSVHHSAAAEFSNIFEGHVATQIMRGINDDRSNFDESAEMISAATYYGPAVMYVDMKQTINGQFVESVWLNAHIPIDTNSFVLFFGVTTRKIPGMTEEQNIDFLNEYVGASQRAFDEDVDIWNHKTRVDNPVLCDGDGPIKVLRQWYQQFYVDADQVPDRWKKKREYTV